ncbi:MAG: hypothetical protein PF482_08815 [Desulfobacteraceae bacterium]|jgi:hypothetical protein|nr:hypothetical protein [Desulfobacteraceae bacterium]
MDESDLLKFTEVPNRLKKTNPGNADLFRKSTIIAKNSHFKPILKTPIARQNHF